MRKLMDNYFKNRIRKKIAHDEQTKRLKAQLKERQIDKQTYERYKIVLDEHYCQKHKEDWVKVENKFQIFLN